MKRLEDDVIERRAGLDVARFQAEYLVPERPVILTDVAERWPAMQRWEPARLVEAWGDRPISAYYHPDGLYTAWKRMRKPSTVGQVLTDHDPRLFLSADIFYDTPYLIPDFDVPHVVRPEWIEDHSSWWVQPKGHRTGLHYDSYDTVLTVIRGRKRFLLFSPEQYANVTPCLVTGSKDFTRASWSQMDVFAPDLDAFPAARDAAYREIFVEAGETLIIPRHWWHAVENLGTPTIAVTFVLAPQAAAKPTFYHDRELIAGLAIKVGLLTGERRIHRDA